MEYHYKPTTNGLAAMAACMAMEKPFRLTRVAFGSGKVDKDTNLADVHELLEYVSDGAVTDRNHKDNRFNITIQYANSEHKEVKTFLLSEFIIYTENPETGNETDLLYGTLGDYRQPVPAYNPAFRPSVFNFPLEVVLSDEVDVIVSAPAGLPTYDDLEDVVWRHNEDPNAHADLFKQNQNGVLRVDITIPTTGWAYGEGEDEPSGQRIDIPCEEIQARMIPDLTILPAYSGTAWRCGMEPASRTLDGALRVYAKEIPAAEMKASLKLVCPSGGASGSGGGGGSTWGIGHGLKVVDGDLAVDTTDDFTGDNTLPMTAAGVQATLGNIEARLGTI